MNGEPHAVECSYPVVVVGAGPTGIAAATLLGQYGIGCLVLDRWENVYPQPRAVHADDEVFRILARLGVRDGFSAISRPALGLRLVDRNMRVLTEIRRDPKKSVHGYPQANMFDQPELETLLRANLKRYPTVDFRGGVEVTAVEQTEPGRVRVSFLDRVHGGEQVVEARYVLGCDGANSMVRSAIRARMQSMGFDQRWLVIDVDTDAELNQWDGVQQLCDRVRAATYMRVSATRYRWEFRLVDGEKAEDFQSLADVLPLISPWVPDGAVLKLRLVRVSDYTFRAQLADRWRGGNVFILGDAAHLTPPFIGQGMCAGLRDAMNLTWKLAGVLADTLPASVLDTYQRERKPHARAMIALAMSVGFAMTAGGQLGTLFRRAVMPLLQHLPGMRSRVVDGVTPPLHSSALVVKSSPRRRLAGRLCPNPILGDARRLDDVVGNRFALVSSSPLTSDQHRKLTARGAVLLTAPRGSELERWLHKRGVSAAIVRPDRTVMKAGRSVGAVYDDIPPFSTTASAAALR